MDEHNRNIHGVLFDLDGVLYVDSQPIPGAVEAVAKIKAGGWICRFVTNTSTSSLATLERKIRALGFPVERSEIISAPQAALRHLRTTGLSAHLLLEDDVKADFAGIPQASMEDAEALVLGDTPEVWTHDCLDRMFNAILRGAQLIAVHKNRFWQTGQGLRMDIGGLVAALEYCAGVRPWVMGKPSADFFAIALRDMGLPPERVAIVGDDIEADIGGGRAAGLYGILVRTGKFRPSQLETGSMQPDRIIDSIADLPDLLVDTLFP
ncbi:TIGR01458 family HAD-type hydrolase [Methylococcus capsulatus]|uniref:Haloacid dehalogenase-like hydrolase domain-containing protein 2 n=1 Tax=Methylococcus capsulatus TaxID=414 RepID=A0AA35UA15_METCP|nr:TIGR01458 family HAD-type hydrolase [Methylococcus capsulatus]QXP88135.1 TIGR01458 family HAD-type hydrolase [Methylococcus capsulatus]QXP94857.1 TIGR01458 family HAD-type hydrolase [Methylococcus capsulatus]UQN13167.1 TIGR01458 family HAD-type hydrolase [Methylococcus capsulatus]CAI8724726.1 Hydrolase, haloacid dehalogenase-like family [Methylococcus capsulatus]